MAVTVETGAVITGSDSYVSRTDYIAYAATLGTTITDDETADYQLVKAAEYIGLHEPNLKGRRTDRDQSMAFPRYDLWINGFSWSSAEIPTQVKNCQMMYALAINDNEDLFNRSTNPNTTVKREKVDGAVEVEYAIKESSQSLKILKADALLRCLLNNGGNSISLVRA